MATSAASERVFGTARNMLWIAEEQMQISSVKDILFHQRFL